MWIFHLFSAINIKNGNYSIDAAGERVDSAILVGYVLVSLPAASRAAPPTSCSSV